MKKLLLLSLLLPILAQATCLPDRDKNGHIKRNHAEVAKFQRVTICPATKKVGACPGYIVDHKDPLCACGADKISNMQYQTYKASLRKDISERKQCRGMGE